MFGIPGERTGADADPDPESAVMTGVVLVAARGGDRGLVTGNGAGVPGRENGVGGHARGPVRVRRSGLRDRDPGIGREARDRGQGRVTGPKGRTGRADVTEEMTGTASKMSPTPRVVSTAMTGWISRGRTSTAMKGALEITTITKGSPSTPTMETMDRMLIKKGENVGFFTCKILCW